MMWTPIVLAATMAATATSPATTLSGRYSDHFRNGQVNGPDYWSDDVVEIVPVDPKHAYIRLDLQFYNGHVCGLAGVAEAIGDALVYHGQDDDMFAGSAPCKLTVRRDDDKLTWNDDNTCKAHCGERGSFMGGSLPWSSKRPISYLVRLKGSREYQRAITEWRAAEPVRQP